MPCCHEELLSSCQALVLAELPLPWSRQVLMYDLRLQECQVDRVDKVDWVVAVTTAQVDREVEWAVTAMAQVDRAVEWEVTATALVDRVVDRAVECEVTATALVVRVVEWVDRAVEWAVTAMG